MATAPVSRIQPGSGEDIPTGTVIYEWVLANAGDDGAPVAAPQYSGKVVMQIAGGGTVTMQGTLHQPSETEVWATLHDPASADLVLTNPEIRQVLEDCVQIRPTVATAGATVRLMVTTPSRR